MRLEDIGFYTLSDHRADTATQHSPLIRCELILTGWCNFNCVYCRGLRKDFLPELRVEDAASVVVKWAGHGLENIRFSGGEPTLWPGLVRLVLLAVECGIRRRALSTNGSAPLGEYDRLLRAGVNDFSISLDARCSADAGVMAGGNGAFWDRLVENIRWLVARTYVTVGVVLTERNAAETAQIVQFAHDLGVADIRVIPAAQYGAMNAGLAGIPENVLNAHPILKYRAQNAACGRGARGLRPGDAPRCSLVLDDMVAMGGHHFPCIIYMREGGDPIGRLAGRSMDDVRRERAEWMACHDTRADQICRANCLDVCIDYNNRAANKSA